MMKTIYKLARTELQLLFYSPIAWLILILFTFQVAMVFTGQMNGMVRNQTLGNSLSNLTLKIYSGGMGSLFNTIQGYLYLYIPLLTMGLMSRELGSGSIKLLYSSPITNTQIILGKFLSMMIYGLVLIGITFLFVVFGAYTIKEFDFPAVLSGLLGIYLLICAYAAVGLFMSSLTSYQVVAAICTLAMLGVLSYVKALWQDIAIVRDVTYWLSISGRADELVGGLICSEDVLYFIIVVALFLGLTIIRLQACRQKSPWTVTWGKYLVVFFAAMFLGYLSSRPTLMTFYDATRTKVRTLTPNSQEVIKKLEGGLTITTYANLLDDNVWEAVPGNVINDMRRFRQYRRFKPEIEMNYVYYYDTIPGERLELDEDTKDLKELAQKKCRIFNYDFDWFRSPEEIRKEIDLTPEGNQFVRLLERENGEKTYLRLYNDMHRFPSEAEITAALKRMVMKLPKVGFLHGHNERDNHSYSNRNYSMFAQDKFFRYALLNQGFDVADIVLDRDVPGDVNILVISDMHSPLTDTEQVYYDRYVARGGNLMIMGEPKRQQIMNRLVEPWGLRFMPGTLVRRTENYLPDFMLGYATNVAGAISYPWRDISGIGGWFMITMPGAVGVEIAADKGFEVHPVIETDSYCWNELETTNFYEDTVRLNMAIGEVQKSHNLAVALSRKVNDREQKILVFGDADWCNNEELAIQRPNLWANNFALLTGSFYWLSDEEVPIDVRRPAPPDTELYLTQDSMAVWAIILKWIIPVLMTIAAIIIWIRRRGR